MDLYRTHLTNTKNAMQAPNGQDKPDYGQAGTAVLSTYTALDDENLNPVEGFLTFRVMGPFLRYIRQPLTNFWHERIKSRKTRSDAKERIIDFRHISAFAKMVTCMLATLSLAVAIGILDIIPDPKIRIVVMTLFGLGFASSVSFFGQDSMPLYHLITA